MILWSVSASPEEASLVPFFRACLDLVTGDSHVGHLVVEMASNLIGIASNLEAI